MASLRWAIVGAGREVGGHLIEPARVGWLRSDPQEEFFDDCILHVKTRTGLGGKRGEAAGVSSFQREAFGSLFLSHFKEYFSTTTAPSVQGIQPEVSVAGLNEP